MNITEKHIEKISSLWANSMPQTLVSEIFLTKNYSKDLILGLKELCINRIFPQIILTRGKK